MNNNNINNSGKASLQSYPSTIFNKRDNIYNPVNELPYNPLMPVGERLTSFSDYRSGDWLGVVGNSNEAVAYYSAINFQNNWYPDIPLYVPQSQYLVDEAPVYLNLKDGERLLRL